MKLTLIVESFLEEDGEDSVVAITKNVDDVHEALLFQERSMRVMGFDYIRYLKMVYNDGQEFGSGW